MRSAVERFFGADNILDDPAVCPKESSEARSTPRRMMSGITEIVGDENGERPGGFVLVIDGGSLHNVRPSSFTDV